MQIIVMLWNGLSGHGMGTIFLKGLFIVALTAVFWISCELLKHMINVFSKLAVDSLRYLAVMVRGWSEREDAGESEGPKWEER